MKTPTPLQRSALAAGALALACTSTLAGDGLVSLVYAGGEALAPEQEARMVALMTAPAGGLTRDEVQQQFADAQRAGALPEAGEMAETPRVLLARSAANERQVREILAAREAERARVAAIEAEAAAAEAQREAQAQAQTTAAAPVDSAVTTAIDGVSLAATADAPGAADASATPAPAVPTDEPHDRPTDRPALAPPEVPIVRPSNLEAQPPVDED